MRLERIDAPERPVYHGRYLACQASIDDGRAASWEVNHKRFGFLRVCNRCYERFLGNDELHPLE